MTHKLTDQEDMFYLGLFFVSPDARRVAAEALAAYAKQTLGRDRAIAEEIGNYLATSRVAD